MLIFPNIDPVIFEIGPIILRWYGLAYAAGILLSYLYIEKINKKLNIFDKKFSDDLIFYYVIGIIIGGRVGFILLYHFAYYSDYYLANPLEIFKIWKGGMAFHGGMIGAITATWLLCRKHKVNFWTIMDLTASIAPIGLFFGRIANFINGELIGRVTNFKFGIIFPHIDNQTRHASQLYEALFEGIILLAILQWALHKKEAFKKPMLISGMFLFLYGLFRFFIGFAREADSHIGLFWNILSMGQILCIPMIVIGSLMIYKKGLKT